LSRQNGDHRGVPSPSCFRRTGRRVTRAGLAGAGLLAAGLTACAHPPRIETAPPPSFEEVLARADALLEQGCYHCIEEALGEYERVGRAGTADSPAAQRKAVRTALLLDQRQRELGLARPSALTLADDLVAEFGEAAADPLAREIVESLPPRFASDPASADLATWRRIRERLPAWQEELRAAAATDDLAAYLAIVLQCQYQREPAPPDPETWLTSHQSPLILFRVALCPRARPELMGALLARVPRFVEARYFLGEVSLGRGLPLEAEAQYLEALRVLPEWPTVTRALGDVDLALEEFGRAVEFYDRTLAMTPDEPNATFGRVKALSYLGRHVDAVASIDTLLARNWRPGDVRYWRALNLYQLGEVAAAWDETVVAKRFNPMDPELFKLAGIVALARNEVPEARANLEYAVSRLPDDCDARFYLAGVDALERRWPESAAGYARASDCYATESEALAARLSEIRTSSMEDDRKDRLLTMKQRQAAAADQARARATYNAAVGYLNAGDREAARALAETVAARPELADQVRELLKRVGSEG